MQNELRVESPHEMSDQRPHVNAPRRSGGDGVPEVFCSDEQESIAMDLSRWRDLALATLMHEGVRGACEMSLYFVDQETIAELNKEHMGKDGPTDVLAFPLDAPEMTESEGPGTPSRGPARPQADMDDVPTLLGDVLVCPVIAEGQSSSHAGNFDDEIALLVVHGTLHVLGFDHDNDEATAVMRDHELSILKTHHWRGNAPSNFRQDHDE